MKIIRITTFLDFGGIERKMENISSWKDEHEWIFVALNKGGDAAKVINANGKRVICLQSPYRIPQLKLIYTLYKLFKKEKPDVVHCAGAEANFHGIIAAKLANVPVKIAEEIGISNQSNTARRIFRYIYKKADYVTGESEAVIKDLGDKYGIPSNKLVKIYNFIKEDLGAQLNARATNAAFTIISVSRLESKKNFELALKVIKRLVDDQLNIKYIIVGDGSLNEKLRGMANDLNLGNHVDFLGYQSNPKQFLIKSDLFLLSSNHEGFSNSLLEAMYAGVASISTAVGGAEDMIVDGVNGWLVQINNEDELYHKLSHIVALPKEQLYKIADEGYKTVENGFTLKNHIAQTYNIYEKK